MNTRTVGWCAVLVLYLAPVVVLAQTRESSNEPKIGQAPTLVGPILAQAQKPTETPKPSQPKAKDAANEPAKDMAKNGAEEMVSQQEFSVAISRIEQRLETITQTLAKVAEKQPTYKQQTTLSPISEQETNQQPTLAEKQASTVQAKPTDQSGPTQADFEALRDRVYDQEVILANIAKRISQPNGPERYIVDIRGNLQNSTFRNELSDAVTEVLPRQGTLHIHNTMDTTQTLTVNRQEYQIAPGDRLAVTVPVGTVTTELVGFEEPRNWTIGPPTNEERIVIGPSRERRVLYQPAESVYGSGGLTNGTTSSPAYTNGAAAAPVYSDASVETPVYTSSTVTSQCCSGY